MFRLEGLGDLLEGANWIMCNESPQLRTRRAAHYPVNPSVSVAVSCHRPHPPVWGASYDLIP